MQNIINSTEVRKNWSEVIDTVVRQKPVFIKRNRDVLTVLSVEQLEILLDSFRPTLEIVKEEDGSYTGIIQELDLLDNAQSQEKLMENLIKDLIEYSDEYMNNLNIYYHSPNRKQHFPYIYKILALEDNFEKIKSLFKIRVEESIDA